MKATIYTGSEFMGNIIKREVTLSSFSFGEYAQYPNALFITCKPKRKSRVGRFVYTPCGGSPDVLVLAGWGLPEPAGMYVEETTTGTGADQVTTSEGRYRSFDTRWQSDFNEMINKAIKAYGLKIIVDTRGLEQYEKAITEIKAGLI